VPRQHWWGQKLGNLSRAGTTTCAPLNCRGLIEARDSGDSIHCAGPVDGPCTPLFDSVNSIEGKYRPYLVQLPATPSPSKDAAAAAAAGTVLAGLDQLGEVRQRTGQTVDLVDDNDVDLAITAVPS
jgi:hypothetical protein